MPKETKPFVMQEEEPITPKEETSTEEEVPEEEPPTKE